MDLLSETDRFMACQKTIIGLPTWKFAPRPNVRLMKRGLLADGEAVDAFIHSQAYPGTNPKEFRHLIVFMGRCVARLDFAPSEDGPHYNPMTCPINYPTGRVGSLHFHDWQSNRQFGNPKALPEGLKCAIEPTDPIDDIDQGFWWFCDQNRISATSSDVPGWPPADQLL